MLRRGALLTSSMLFGPLLGAAVLRSHGQDVVVRTLSLTRHASYGAMVLDGVRHRAYVLNRLDDSLTLLDTRSGMVLRTLALNPGSPGTFATDLVRDRVSGHLFVSTDDGTIHMLDAGTLRLLGTIHVAEWAGPNLLALAPETGTLFVVGTIPGAYLISLFDTRNSTLLRRVSGPYAYRGAALDRRGRLFVIGYGSSDVSVFDETTAVPRRFRTVSGVPAGGFGGITADPASDLLYPVGLYSDTVYTIVARTGAFLPPIGVSGAVLAVFPTGVPDRVLIVDDTGALNLADAQRGRVLRIVRVGLGEGFPYALDAARGLLFSWDMSGVVEEIDLSTGRLLRTIRVGRLRPAQIALNPLTGHLLLLYPGANSRSGRAVGGSMRAVHLLGDPAGPSVSLGPDPSLLGIDVRSRLAFVVNGSGDPKGPEGPPSAGTASSWLGLLRHWLPFVAATLDPPAAGGTVSVLDAARL